MINYTNIPSNYNTKKSMATPVTPGPVYIKTM